MYLPGELPGGPAGEFAEALKGDRISLNPYLDPPPLKDPESGRFDPSGGAANSRTTAIPQNASPNAIVDAKADAAAQPRIVAWPHCTPGAIEPPERMPYDCGDYNANGTLQTALAPPRYFPSAPFLPEPKLNPLLLPSGGFLSDAQYEAQARASGFPDKDIRNALERRAGRPGLGDLATSTPSWLPWAIGLAVFAFGRRR